MIDSGVCVLDGAQVASFWQRGYIVVDDVVAGDLLEKLRVTVDRHLERSRERLESDDLYELALGHTFHEPRLRRIRSPIRMEPIFRRLALEGVVPQIVAQLIGPDVKYHHGKVNLKTTLASDKVQWHQDFAFAPHTNMDLVAVAIALDDVTPENGCVSVIPGSHRGPIYSHYLPDGRFAGAISAPLDPALLATADFMRLKPGSISIHHSVAVHSSGANTSGLDRRLFINQYVAADALALSKNSWLHHQWRDTGLTESVAMQHDGYIVAGVQPRVVRMVSATVTLPPDWSNVGHSAAAPRRQ